MGPWKLFIVTGHISGEKLSTVFDIMPTINYVVSRNLMLINSHKRWGLQTRSYRLLFDFALAEKRFGSRPLWKTYHIR